jgi:hypothetical protein
MILLITFKIAEWAENGKSEGSFCGVFTKNNIYLGNPNE